MTRHLSASAAVKEARRIIQAGVAEPGYDRATVAAILAGLASFSLALLRANHEGPDPWERLEAAIVEAARLAGNAGQRGGDGAGGWPE